MVKFDLQRRNALIQLLSLLMSFTCSVMGYAEGEPCDPSEFMNRQCDSDCSHVILCQTHAGQHFWVNVASCGEETCHLFNGSAFCSQTESDCPAPTPEPPTSDGLTATGLSAFTPTLSSITTEIATTSVRQPGVQQSCDYAQVYTSGCTGPVLREITTGISWPRCLVSCHLHDTCICVQYKGYNSCLFYEGVE